jgi:hypothetical protein
MIDVFVWEMFKGLGVGHASMFVHGEHGKAYISWWPAAGSGLSRAVNGIESHGLVHSIHADIEEDGTPDWCSKPLRDLDERAIIEWWKGIACSPNLRTGTEVARSGSYTFLVNNCACTVVRALILGSSSEKRERIRAYFSRIMLFDGRNTERFFDRLTARIVAGVGSRPAVARSFMEASTSLVDRRLVVAPYDCRNIVEEVWK